MCNGEHAISLKNVFFISTGKTNQYDRLLIREIYHKVRLGVRVFDESSKSVHNFTNLVKQHKILLAKKVGLIVSII
jgi:hypothetical protein